MFIISKIKFKGIFFICKVLHNGKKINYIAMRLVCVRPFLAIKLYIFKYTVV